MKKEKAFFHSHDSERLLVRVILVGTQIVSWHSMKFLDFMVYIIIGIHGKFLCSELGPVIAF